MTKIFSFILAFVFLFGGLFIINDLNQTYAAGVSRNVARVATSSTITVGPNTVKTLFLADAFCADRLIGVASTPLTISFSSSVVPATSTGYVLAASSTGAFNSENYGCGAITAFAQSSTTITITELLQ